MRIGENTNNYWMDNVHSLNGKEQANIKETVVADEPKQTLPTNELQTYQALCKQFPNITFRLTDRSEQYGFYENGFHQKGKNFGGHAQCSIDVDIEVIRRMQGDEDYALHVRGSIERIERNYAEYEAEGNADGYKYTCANLSHEDGRLTTSITHSMQPFSTEEEIKEMWGLTEPCIMSARLKMICWKITWQYKIREKIINCLVGIRIYCGFREKCSMIK